METDTDRHFIERMHWDEVARRIGDGAVAILPIGAAAKQHGFHLPLNTDRIQAEWLAGRMAEKIDALIWPTLTYGHYPAFVEYAGSSSLSISTFEALVREVAAQILGSGCPKLLVLNTGISTLAPVDRALARLASERVKHLWIHEGPRYPRVARQLAEQSHGSHADELETSLMLALAPHLVDMTRAEASPDAETGDAGRIDAVGPEFAELQPLRQLWRSDTGDIGQGRSLARRHARRSPRTGRRVHRARHRAAPTGRGPKRAEMKAAGAFRWTVAAAVLAAMLASALSFRADAQSEYMRGDRMPYDAFDRLPRTDLEVPGGTIHVAFAPGDITLPQRKTARLDQDVGPGRHDLLRAVSRHLAAAVIGAGRWRAHPRRHDVGLSRRRHSHSARPRFHRGCLAARLGDGARDGAYRPARYARSLRLAVGGTGRLCRAGRAGAGRRPHRRGKSGRR